MHSAARIALLPVRTAILSRIPFSQMAASIHTSHAPALSPTTQSPQLRFQPAERVSSFGDSVFATFTALAIKHGAVNLGQGFPDFPAPDFIKAAAAKAITEANLNQYVRSMGHLRLVKTLAEHYSKPSRLDRALDPLTEIVVTAGATEATFATFQSILNPGDEVILMEPFYDAYPAQIAMAGGVPKYVPLRPRDPSNVSSSDDWYLDFDELYTLFTSRTKAVVINNPHNPLGKVFRKDELETLARIIQKKNVLAISDEVYDHLVFPDAPGPHISLASLPGMAERTITFGSAGKTFSVTGWKIGWAIAPPSIARAIFLAHQWIPFCVAAPLQEAVAEAIELAERNGFFTQFPLELQRKRDRLMKGLEAGGLKPILPHGGYFVLADTSALWARKMSQDTAAPGKAAAADDVTICKWMTETVGVVPIPPSSFLIPEHAEMMHSFARFAFCKQDSVIDEACGRLSKFGSSPAP